MSPAFLTVCTIIMMILTDLITAKNVSFSPLTVIGSMALWLTAVVILIATTVQLNQYTSVDQNNRRLGSKFLLQSGMFAISRNPKYLALLLSVVGSALWLANFANILWLVAYFACVHYFKVLPKEKALADRFGQPYIDYSASVRRWI
ncbi:Protein-S-isoprenylcysteine O-methyltransferase Ste14 [Thalassotalea agarivorans]|uniref:Protein-S-isoprenylcysteine O-methyltransferase Ste14 n=2 Tax=Thalassotalea agarivorans TaxID=349064 RepID=A0A1H9ZTR5_THASX|nr:Protein-S-isoprenylcysteine O-methyltransferase Ste14 [Thalassotalea agarivorans]